MTQPQVALELRITPALAVECFPLGNAGTVYEITFCPECHGNGCAMCGFEGTVMDPMDPLRTAPGALEH
ncbi:hypothetical protein C4587_01110 [Candidatus Parcubacteria bacterium]|nr:MAG: hypothetical protein C4587_01110 [Candidatus Parcubacteria bacterium]